MPRKPKPHRTLMKSPSRKYSDDDDKSRFVFTVDPQCIITFPIDHCLYVCDICSSVLKSQDCFKKHYINLHINHAHATLSDLKFCEAFPINLSKFKEDEGWFRCHFCINLFFNEKSELKSHLNQHDPLQEIPEDKTVMETEEIKQKPEAHEKSDGFSLLEAISGNYQEYGEISVTHVKHCVEPARMYVNELIPLPSVHDDNLVAISSMCNQEESDYEPLSGLLGSSLNTLFNTSIIVPPETHDLTSNCIESTEITSNLERSSSPIFAQDCLSSQNALLELPLVSKFIESTPVLQPTLEDVPVVSSYYTLSSLPESGITSLTLPPKESSRSSPSSSSGFSSASTDELQQFEDNDVFESSVVRSEESFSSVTSSKSNSDEEAPPVGKNLFEININNIVLSCLFCDKIFASIKSTKAHMLKFHQANEIHWQCVFCQLNFKNCDLLLNHLCSNHSDVYFACISCKVRFDSKAFMDTHFQNKHNSENDNKYSESKNKDDILHQLKCIPYYTNQNVICNSLSRKMKMRVFDKLNSSSKKKYNQKQVTNKSVQVTEDDISQKCNQESMALNCTASILKRKLTENHPVSHRHSTRSKIIKMSETFMMNLKEEESKLCAKSPHNSSFEEKIPIETNSVREELTTNINGSDKEMKTIAEKEIETSNGIEVLCLFCNKISSSEKGSKAHVARIHKMRRGGKICCYCRSNFRTLDLLFNHLCSNHSQVYFGCSFCKERFNGKSSLLMHFEGNHNSVNITTEDIEENVKENSNVQQKELFMFELKCLPTYSYTPICSSNCNLCEGGNSEELPQGSDILVLHTSSDSTNSLDGELGTIHSTSENILQQNLINEQEEQKKQLINVLDNNKQQDQLSVSGSSLSVEISLAIDQTQKYDQGGLQKKLKLDGIQELTLQEIAVESDLLNGKNQKELDSLNFSTPQLIEMESDLSKDTIQVGSVSQKPLTEQEMTKSDVFRDNNQVELMTNYSETKDLEVIPGFVENVNSSFQKHISGGSASECCLDSTSMSIETFENSRNKILNEYWKERFCLYCDRMFDKSKAYRVHLFRSHKAKKNKCMFCDSIINYHEDLFSHLVSIHKEIYFACGICKMRFDTKSSFNNHVDQYHNPDKNYASSVPQEESSSSIQIKTDNLELKEVNGLEFNSISENSEEQGGPAQFEKSNKKENDEIEKGNGPIQPIETITPGQTRKESTVIQSEDNFKHTEEYQPNQNIALISGESKCLDTIELTNESTQLIQRMEIKNPLLKKSGGTRVEPVQSEDVNCAHSREVKSLLDHLISDVEVATNCVHELPCVQKCSRRVSNASLTKLSCSTSKMSQEQLLRDQQLETNEDLSNLTNGKETKLTIDTANGVVLSVPNLSEPNNHCIATKYKTTNPRQLINYSHPEYKNLAQRNYSQLDITVQIQILDRVKSFTNGKLCTGKYPSKRPQRQQKPPGPVSGKREFSGEWARAKNYFCANCGSHFVNFWDFDVHRWNAHPNVACSVYDFYVEDTPPCYFEPTSWPYNRVPQQTIDLMKQQTKQSPSDSVKQCTKCGKSFVHSASFHKHLISCAQHNRVQNKAKVSWKEPDNLNGSKRKRRSCRGLKSILDTPPKLPPSHVFTTNSRKSPRARIKTSKERLLSDKTNRSLFSFDKNVSNEELNDSKGELMLTRSQSAISNIDEKTKELIEKFERGKYSSHTSAESFTRRLTKTKPKDCS